MPVRQLLRRPLSLACARFASRPIAVLVLVAALAPAGCGSSRGRPNSVTGGGDCVETTHQCVGTTWQVCEEAAWKEVTRCPTACDPGRGCVTCLPGQKFCNGDTITTCKDDGTAGEAVLKCPGGACSGGVCVDPCSMAGAELSYIGCHYWPTVTANSEVPGDSHFAVAVANPNDTPADVMVTRPGGGMGMNAQVPPGGLSTIKLPWVDELRTAKQSALVAGGAYRLDSSLPVTVYQFNPLEFQVEPCGMAMSCPTYTNDASLLLPQHTLTGHYIAVSRPALLFVDKTGGIFPSEDWRARYPGFISIVGTESGDTKVSVKFTAPTTAGSGGIGTYAAGQTATFTIKQSDVLQLFAAVPDRCTPAFTEKVDDNPFAPETIGYCDLPATDLTGTEITADQHVAVFSGHVCDFVPFNRWACDHLEEQMLPLESWGKKYAVAKIQRKPANIPDLVRVVSGANGNAIDFDPPSVHARVTLDRGKWMEFPVTEDFVATGSEAFLITQFMVGQDYFGMRSGNSDPGDPAMNLAVPVEQYRSSYIFLAPETYVLNYVNVTAPAGMEVMLDGMPIGGQLKSIGGGAWAAGRIPITAGTHNISSAQPLGIQVYGLAPYTSYMYPGGLDVKVINVQ